MNDSYGSTRCDNICSRDASGDGYTACSPIGGKAIAVWRQFAATPTYSFESSTSGFSVVPTAGSGSLARVTDKFIHGTHSMLATLPGNNMTVFVNIPTGQNWTYIQAYAQHGPANNDRFNTMGYLKSQVIPGQWTSIVVPVPANFAVADSKVGVQLFTNGSGTIKLYVDAFSFDD